MPRGDDYALIFEDDFEQQPLRDRVEDLLVRRQIVDISDLVQNTDNE